MTLVAGWPSERNRGRTEPATGSGTCWQTRGIRGQDRSTDRGIHAERRWHRKDLRQRLLMTSAGHPSRCLIGTFFFLLLIAMLKVWKSMVSFCFGNYIEQWPKVLRFTRIFIFKVCCLSFYDGNVHILQNVMKTDQMNCNCKTNTSTAFQPCHKRISWHHFSDSVNTGESIENDAAQDDFHAYWVRITDWKL